MVNNCSFLLILALLYKMFVYWYLQTKITFKEASKIFVKHDKKRKGSMDMQEFIPAFKELISSNLSKKEIKDGVIFFLF